MHLPMPPHSHSSPFKMLQVPGVFYWPHVSQVSFPRAMERNAEKRPLALFFMVDDSSILAYTELCPLSCPPRGWVFISLTSWSGSRTAIIQNSPFHWLKSDFWGFTLLMFQCKNPHSKPPQRAIHFHPLHSPSRDRRRLRELSRGHASSYS